MWKLITFHPTLFVLSFSIINTCILITQRKLNTNSQSYHFCSPHFSFQFTSHFLCPTISFSFSLSLCFDKIHFYLMLNQKSFILSSDKNIVQHNTARYMFISHAFPELISLLFLRISMMNNNFFFTLLWVFHNKNATNINFMNVKSKTFD